MTGWEHQSQWRRLAIGGAGSLLGTALVVLGLAAMHGPDAAGEETAVKEQVVFDLPQAKKPPPRKRQEKKPPARRRKGRAKKTQGPPRVATALSGMSFGLEAYSADTSDTLDANLLGNTDDVVMTEGTVDVAPRALRRPTLTIPERLRRKGVGGAVVMSLLIDKSGNVEVVKVLESNPPGLFDDLATDFVRQWAFEPATYRGKAVKTWAKQTLTFKPQ